MNQSTCVRSSKLSRAAGSAVAVVIVTGMACVGPFASGRRAESGEWGPGTASHEVAIGADARFFLLHVPSRQPRNLVGLQRPFPLILVLHGSGADGESVRHASQLDSIADARGFLVVYPHATKGPLGLFGADWNAGSCCGAASREKVDDVAFLLSIMDRVASKLPVDVRRVYVAGFSDGGRMAYRMACAAAPRIAAIGVVAGSLRDGGCAPTVPVPLVAFHATGDKSVPYDERSDAPASRPLLPESTLLPPSVQVWAANNGCQSLAQSKISPHVTRHSFSRCGAEVMLYSIDGGGHGWPGEPGSGAPMSELGASEAMIRFFARHSR